MVHHMASLKQPCMQFEPAFEYGDLEKVKIKYTTTGRNLVTRSRKVPAFSGKGGIEALLYCEDHFRSACTHMHVPAGPNQFDLFSEIMQNTVETT